MAKSQSKTKGVRRSRSHIPADLVERARRYREILLMDIDERNQKRATKETCATALEQMKGIAERIANVEKTLPQMDSVMMHLFLQKHDVYGRDDNHGSMNVLDPQPPPQVELDVFWALRDLARAADEARKAVEALHRDAVEQAEIPRGSKDSDVIAAAETHAMKKILKDTGRPANDAAFAADVAIAAGWQRPVDKEGVEDGGETARKTWGYRLKHLDTRSKLRIPDMLLAFQG